MSREFGSVEVEYTYTLNNAHTILLRTDIEGVAQFAPAGTELRTMSIRFGTKVVSSNDYTVVSLMLSSRSESETVDTSDFNLGPTGLETLRVRIFIFNQYISVYCNNLWVFSHALRRVQYPRATVECILVYEGGAGYITNIVRRELADGREAIWIDYEATGDNTIQSVIQQRPVEVFPRSGRAVAFSYNVLDRDEIIADWVNNYTSTIEDNSQMSSDGLVYYRDVGVSMHADTA